jgi:hypothetical protein
MAGSGRALLSIRIKSAQARGHFGHLKKIGNAGRPKARETSNDWAATLDPGSQVLFGSLCDGFAPHRSAIGCVCCKKKFKFDDKPVNCVYY